MRLMIGLAAWAALSGCALETYTTAEGKTSLRPKYEAGTRVVYEDGTYSHNMKNNRFRPEQHVLKPQQQKAEEKAVRGVHWQ
ncbi:MAG: spore cortex protein [Neisseria sp.]|nr:spore cortex protein [Neisseria sp.]